MKSTNFEIEFYLDGIKFDLFNESFQSFIINENMFRLTPIYVLDIVDLGNEITKIPLATGENITAIIKNQEDDTTFTFNTKLSSYMCIPGKDKTHGAIKFWLYDSLLDDLSSKTHQEKYTGATSEIASSLVNAMDPLITTHIETSSNSIDFTLPGWTYGQCLQFLAQHSKGMSADYAYFFDKAREFHFCSMSNLISGQQIKQFEIDDTASEIETSNFFITQELKNNTKSMLLNGAKGEYTTLFDWTTGLFEDIEITISDTNQKGISSHLSFKSSDKESDCRMIEDFGIIDDNVNKTFYETAIKCSILRKTNDMIKFGINCTGDLNLTPGKIIKIIVSSADSNEIIDTVHSGKWLISKCLHIFEKNLFLTKIDLIRNGLNLDSTYLSFPGGSVT